MMVVMVQLGSHCEVHMFCEKTKMANDEQQTTEYKRCSWLCEELRCGGRCYDIGLGLLALITHTKRIN
jgi:hypothetical protein